VGALGLATKHSAEEDERYLENEHLYESLLLKARNEIGRRLTYNSSITLVQ